MGTAPPPGVVQLNLTLSDQVVATVPDYFRSVTLDWWKADDKKYGKKWGNSSILTINLKDPALLTLASALAPGILRIGGSPEDSITYDLPAGTCLKQRAAVAAGAPHLYYCSQVEPGQYGCLTEQRWKEIHEFADRTGLKLVFGLNACYERHHAYEHCNLGNIKSLLAATAGQPWNRLWGLEFGNELNADSPLLAHKGISAKAWSEDFLRLSGMVNELWAGHNATRPRLIGPDTAPDMVYDADVVHFTEWTGKPGTLHALSYHQYLPDGCRPKKDSKDGTVLSLKCLEAIPDTAYTIRSDLQGTQIELWAGETALEVHGGVANWTDTFRSSFYYMYQLGELSARNVSVVARQTLMGGDYELIDRNTRAPNPDYWTAWMWGRFMGGSTTAHQRRPTTSELPGFRVWSQNSKTAPGRNSVLLMNMYSNRTVAVSLPAGNVTLYEVRQKPSAPREVLVNGQLLSFAGALPTLRKASANGLVNVRPESMVFMTV